LMKTCRHQLERKQWKLLEFNQRLATASPNLVRIEEQQKELTARLHSAYIRYFEILSVQLQHVQAQLSHLNPQSVLERGYSITYTAQNTIIRDGKQIHCGDRIQVKFAHGMCEADVTKTENS